MSSFGREVQRTPAVRGPAASRRPALDSGVGSHAATDGQRLGLRLKGSELLYKTSRREPTRAARSEATPRIPEATPRLPRGYPEATPRFAPVGSAGDAPSAALHVLSTAPLPASMLVCFHGAGVRHNFCNLRLCPLKENTCTKVRFEKVDPVDRGTPLVSHTQCVIHCCT